MEIGAQTTPRLSIGKLIPLFSLPSTAGGSSGPGALRSRYNVVLTFVGRGQEERDYLIALCEAYPQVAAESARVLCVVQGDIDDAEKLRSTLSLPFQLLVDADGSVTERMLGGTHLRALCVADRYGEVVHLAVAAEGQRLPAPQIALDWLAFIQSQCPE